MLHSPEHTVARRARWRGWGGGAGPALRSCSRSENLSDGERMRRIRSQTGNGASGTRIQNLFFCLLSLPLGFLKNILGNTHNINFTLLTILQSTSQWH